MGHPLNKTTMMGAQASFSKKNIVLYKTGREEGAELLIGGDVKKLGGDLDGGYTFNQHF
jgi:aldehyde dehydrogenase